MKYFFSRISKVLGGIGGGGFTYLIEVGLNVTHHSVPPAYSGLIPIVGGALGTYFAPANTEQLPKSQ